MENLKLSQVNVTFIGMYQVELQMGAVRVLFSRNEPVAAEIPGKGYVKAATMRRLADHNDKCADDIRRQLEIDAEERAIAAREHVAEVLDTMGVGQVVELRGISVHRESPLRYVLDDEQERFGFVEAYDRIIS